MSPLGNKLIWDWDPELEIWTAVTALCVDRNYHGASVVPLTQDLLNQCTEICGQEQK